MRGIVLWLDSLFQRITPKLSFARGSRAKRIMKVLAGIAATPGLLEVFYPVVAYSILLGLLGLAMLHRNDDNIATAIVAFVRLTILVLAAGSAMVFIFAPSLLVGSLTAALALSAMGEYADSDPT